MIKEKIAIFGSAVQEAAAIVSVAAELGEALSHHDIILITGACTGIPYQVAAAAHAHGLKEIWGFSPARNWDEQVAQTPTDDNSIYSRLIYTPKDFPYIFDLRIARKYRNVLSTATCDAGIIVSGRWGSVNEFTNLYDMEKVIGVLSGSGGFADLLPDWQTKITKPNNSVVIFDGSPKTLVNKVIEAVARRGGPRDIPENL